MMYKVVYGYNRIRIDAPSITGIHQPRSKTFIGRTNATDPQRETIVNAVWQRLNAEKHGRKHGTSISGN